MAYVVSARWTALASREARLAELLEELTAAAREEPGCLQFQAHRSIEDPLLFWLYEQYADKAAYEAHMASEHFTRLVKEEAIPDLLASREREFFTTFD